MPRIGDFSLSFRSMYQVTACFSTVEPDKRILRFTKAVSTIALPNLILFEGKQNYQSWSDQMIMVFTAIGLYGVVIKGAKS